MDRKLDEFLNIDISYYSKLIEQQKKEPLLYDDPDRYFAGQTKDDRLVFKDLFKKHQKCYWIAEEIKMDKDKLQFPVLASFIKGDTNMTLQMQNIIKGILAFFSISDGIVNENIVENFMKEFKMYEIREFYAFQMMIENVHNEAYTNQILSLIPQAERKDIFHTDRFSNAKGKKIQWIKHFLDKEAPLAVRLLAYTCVEGIQFSGSFCIIYWFKSKNLLPGLSRYNELISRDESLHAEFSILLYKNLKYKLTKEQAHDIVRSAVDFEIEFIKEIFKLGDLPGMTQNAMIEYIKYIGDYWLKKLDYEIIYNAHNPFPFMEFISLGVVANFHDVANTDYINPSEIQTGDEEFENDF
jgi:ribonucleoside-diphosphate reductase beta chain